MPYDLLDDMEATPSIPQSGLLNILGAGVRNIGRLAARGVETAIGFPKETAQGALDIANFAGRGIQRGIESIPGIGTTLGKLTGGESLLLPQEIPFGQYLPSSETAKEYITKPLAKYLPNKFLEPQGKYEQLADDYFKDLTSLALGGVKKGSATAMSAVGNLGSFLSKEFGFGESTQAGVKIGGMMLTSMLGQQGVRSFMKDLYSYADEIAPEGAMVFAKNLEPTLSKIEKTISKGGETPSKAFMSKRISEIKSKMYDGKIPIDEAWAFKKDINEWIRAKDSPQGIVKLLNPLSHDLKQTIKSAKNKYPEFVGAVVKADDINMGLNKASALNRKLQEHITPEKVGAISGAVLLGTQSPFSAVKTAATAYTLKNVVKGFEALKNSSEIRNYYYKTLAAAAKDNIPVMTRMASEMDKKMNKFYPENKGTIPSLRYELVE